jgi:sugar porter (SP) family MFS transporter
MKNKYVILSAFTASLGGLLFGYDTAVISGAEREIQYLFQLNDFWHGFTIAIALIGTLMGALISGFFADRIGRKRSLLLVALLYGMSAIGCGQSNTWITFLIFRFIGGVGVGASSVIGPMYIAEISPARLRGRLVTSFQLNIVFGILLSYLANYWIVQNIEHDPWRWMLGVQAIPASIFFILAWFIPFSPRWLVSKGRLDEAVAVLRKVASENPEQEVKEIQASISGDVGSNREKLFQKRYRIPIILAILLAVFNQFSGINAIMYYAPRIFEMVGYAQDSALLQSISVGITLFIFTISGMLLIDKVGRKKLLLVGSIGMTFFLTMVSHTVFANVGSSGSIWMLIYLCGFITFFSFSQGTVIWVFISEIFPNSVRTKGQTLGSFTHWLSSAFISWMFPIVSGYVNGGWAFALFALFMAIQFFVVWRFFPETKGRTLEEIQKEIIR